MGKRMGCGGWSRSSRRRKQQATGSDWPIIGTVRRNRALAMPLAIALVAAACSGSSQPDDTPGSASGPDDVGVNVDSNDNTTPSTDTDQTPEPSTDTGREPEPEPVVVDVGQGEIVLTAQLVRFDECDALLEHLRSEAAARVGPWGLRRLARAPAFGGRGAGPGARPGLRAGLRPGLRAGLSRTSLHPTDLQPTPRGSPRRRAWTTRAPTSRRPAWTRPTSSRPTAGGSS